MMGRSETSPIIGMWIIAMVVAIVVLSIFIRETSGKVTEVIENQNRILRKIDRLDQVISVRTAELGVLIIDKGRKGKK